MPDFKVRVTKDYLVFCSAHFITYGQLCETLHGHNYRVEVVLEGQCDHNAYVFDFVALKRFMKVLCDELDHRMLLPAHNGHLRLQEEGRGLAVYYKNKKYLFPQEDVRVLPITNTTAEMLAQYLVKQIEAELIQRGTANIETIQVEVEETFGQAATCRYHVPQDSYLSAPLEGEPVHFESEVVKELADA